MRNPVNVLNVEHLSRHQQTLKLYWKSIWKLKYSKIHSDLSLLSSLFKFNLSSSMFLMTKFLITGPEAVFFLSIFASFSSHNRKYWNNFKTPNTSFYYRSFLSHTQWDGLKIKVVVFRIFQFLPKGCFLSIFFSLSLPLPHPSIY